MSKANYFAGGARRVGLVTGALLLSSCAAPYYQPTANDAMVSFVGEGSAARLVIGSTLYLPVDESAAGEALFRVPSNAMVTIQAYVHASSSQGSAVCKPALSFQPAANQKYIVGTITGRNACYMQLVREDKTVLTGVVREPSVQKPSPEALKALKG